MTCVRQVSRRTRHAARKITRAPEPTHGTVHVQSVLDPLAWQVDLRGLLFPPREAPMIRRTGIVRRRRKSGEYFSRRAAIRNHCLECCAYDRVEVEHCASPACHLYPWRFGASPDAASSRGMLVDFRQRGQIDLLLLKQRTTPPSGHNGAPSAIGRVIEPRIQPPTADPDKPTSAHSSPRSGPAVLNREETL